jgi:HlyD family secretion protein
MTIPVKAASMPKALTLLAASMFILMLLQFHPGVVRSEEDEEGEAVAPEEMEAKITTDSLKSGELPVILKVTGVCILNQETPPSLMLSEANFEKVEAAVKTAEAELKNGEAGGLAVLQAELDASAKEAVVVGEQARLVSAHEDELLAENLTSEQSARDARAAMEIALQKAATETKKAELFRTSGRELEHDRLKAALASAQADLKTAELDLSTTRLVSPAAPGTGSTGEGKASLFELWISPLDAGALQAGGGAVVYGVSTPDGISAKITSIGSGVDAETGLVRVTAEGESQETSFLIGEAVTADLTSGSLRKGFVVPVSAITFEDDNASVYVVDKDQIAHMVSISVLARNAEEAVITGESLAEGATVITDGNYNLPDGAHVTQGADK